MKICAYVPESHVKTSYVNESFNTRLYAGLAVVVDILRRAGYEVQYAGRATVDRYDVVLVSITSDCDWWPFVRERVTWPKGTYRVIVGGPGVLNVRPFVQWFDYAVLGRAEGIIDSLVKAIEAGDAYAHESVIESASFDPNRHYWINQVDHTYPHVVRLENGQEYRESAIGCNHRCLFCGYTWHRRSANVTAFGYGDLWTKNGDVERAIMDIARGVQVDMVRLRTTAIDGMSERLRFAVNKRISREMLREFFHRLATCDKPHQVKIYNILGYPTETENDWHELLEDIVAVDAKLPRTTRQTCLLLHSTPFRAMPATPLACKPMSYRNYRGAVARTLGKGLDGNIFYQGNSIWAVESMGTESLPTVIQSAIVLRGDERDADNIARVATSSKFAQANAAKRQVTLERYFDVARLFGEFTAETLPTKYLRTYARVEQCW